MATESAVDALITTLSKGIAYREENITSRPEWGSINLEAAKDDIERALSIMEQLYSLPLDQLTDAAIKLISDHVVNVVTQFDNVAKFKIEDGNPTQVRESHINEIHSRTELLYNNAAPWIPFLAYLKGDVESNLKTLKTTLNNADQLFLDASNNIEEKSKTIDSIITAAREASAGTGAAVFSHDFNDEATDLFDKARTWLRITAYFAFGTIGLALIMYFNPTIETNSGVILQMFGSKIAVLGILIAATIWCGRNYKSLMHQATVNKHRALSLQTFQAFSHAASDNQTKDAVLLETTRAIFGKTATGYIDQNSEQSDGQTRIVEVARAAPVVNSIVESTK